MINDTTVAHQFLNNDMVYVCKWSIRCEANSQSEKSGTLDLHCKWFKIEKGIDYEDIISQLKPYSLLLYVSNESFIEKVRSKSWCILMYTIIGSLWCILSLLSISSGLYWPWLQSGALVKRNKTILLSFILIQTQATCISRCNQCPCTGIRCI